MGRMIQDILDIWRAEQVGLALHKTRISLDTWIPGLLKDVESRAQSRAHKLDWDCPAGLEIEVDEPFLRRLLLNLLDNAMKYSPVGSRTRIEARATEQSIRLEVHDQGHGIPKDMRDQVFKKFVRLDEGGPNTRSSSGLGLAFCRLIAEAHEGRIWVEGNLPKGSSFVLELPEARTVRDQP
jgi:signal transduction histidine kinase